MKLLEGVITAFSILGSNKLRSFLTMLGIVIGIAGVIAMMSFGAGAKTLLMWEVEKVGGPSMFGVYRREWIRKNEKWMRNPSKHYLKMEDVRAIQTECPSVEVATPEAGGQCDGFGSGETQVLSDASYRTGVSGCTQVV